MTQNWRRINHPLCAVHAPIMEAGQAEWMCTLCSSSWVYVHVHVCVVLYAWCWMATFTCTYLNKMRRNVFCGNPIPFWHTLSGSKDARRKGLWVAWPLWTEAVWMVLQSWQRGQFSSYSVTSLLMLVVEFPFQTKELGGGHKSTVMFSTISHIA